MPSLPAAVEAPTGPRLAGKTAVVFGAGQSPGEAGFMGNGRATVLRMAQEGGRLWETCLFRDLLTFHLDLTLSILINYGCKGCRVLSVDVDFQSAAETAKMANSQPNLPLSNPVVPFKADVSKESEIKAALDECVKLWGQLSIMHYNVGVSVGAGDGPILGITQEAFERVTRLNLWVDMEIT